MKKLNIRRFASTGFDMYTQYRENYDQDGNCISVTITAIASLDIVRVEKNGLDVSSEWGGLPTIYATKVYTSNITETLTFFGSDGGQHTETIDIISVETTPFHEFASDANIKLNSDIKVNRLTLGEIDSTVSALFDLIYPVGSIYYTNNANFSPNVSFNGTWEQIKDVFLLAAGDTYVGGTDGGEATHKLVPNEMPSHSHTLRKNVPYGIPYNNTSGAGSGSGGTMYGETYTPFTVENSGGDQPHNNMPPYIVVYVWKRVS